MVALPYSFTYDTTPRGSSANDIAAQTNLTASAQ